MSDDLTKSPWYRDLTIGDRAAGRRVDSYLSLRFPDWSRTWFATRIKAGLVVSEERALKPSSKLRLGEKVRIHIPGIAPTEAPPPLPPVLYEDDRVVVLDKPPGLLCHPAGGRWAYAVIGLLRRERPDDRIDLVHRLDRDTSGVLVLTKDLDANVFLKDEIQARRVHKIYQAVSRGRIPWDQQEIRAPIGDHPDSEVRLKQGVVPDGKKAWTTARVLARVGPAADAAPPSHPDGHTLVELTLHTGRTHQIRLHMDHVGFPLLGDRLYGQPDQVFIESLEKGPDDPFVRTSVGFPRQALHCASMSFNLPGGGSVTVHAPLAADLQAIVDGAAPRWPVDGDGA
ncbi:MAG: RluA family pseudouridine synthase [Alphaproteobacteria bacterium]|nr:RluA family pseudouridine synthase [Alphaproteobacteria bacterium]